MKNKKGIVALLLFAFMFAASGCSKKAADIVGKPDNTVALEDGNAEIEEAVPETSQPQLIPVKTGAYTMEYVEEIEGIKTKFNSYILFKEDKTGFYIGNDDVPMTWDEKSIIFTDGTSFSYVVNGDGSVTVTRDEITDSYNYIGAELPEDVVFGMAYNIDGTLKINNMQAADEFNYIITSDTIDFYDYEGNISYSAAGEDFNTMRAAYYELTEAKMPVLFIESPGAPHYVGYSHALQYIDGKVYNNASFDDFRELYLNSGIIVCTYTGGGYGETNYFYYGFNADGMLEEKAFKIIMDSEEYAKSYEEMFGETFVDTYYITTDGVDRSEVTKEEFDSWVQNAVGSESPSEINWLPLDKVFYFSGNREY